MLAKNKYTTENNTSLELADRVLRERHFPSEIQSHIPKVDLYVFNPDGREKQDWVSTGMSGLLVCTFDNISRTIQIHLINPLVQQVIYSHLNVVEFVQQSSQFFSFDAKVSDENNPYSKGTTESISENNWGNPLEFKGYNYIIGLQIPADSDNSSALNFYNTITAILKMKQQFKSMKKSTTSLNKSVELPTQKLIVSSVKKTPTTNTVEIASIIKPPSMSKLPLKNDSFEELHKSLAPTTEKGVERKSDIKASSKYSEVTPNTPSPDDEDEEAQMAPNNSISKKHKRQSLFSKLFHKKSSTHTEGKEHQKSKHRVSLPKSFAHVAHITYSKESGFSNLNPEWKNLFLKAGITEEEIHDPKTAKFLLQGIGVLAEEEQKNEKEMQQQQADVLISSVAKKGTPPPIPTRPKPKTNLALLKTSVPQEPLDVRKDSKPDNMLQQIRNFKLSELSKVEHHIDIMRQDEDKFTARLAALIEMKRSERGSSPIESDGEFSDA